MDEPTNNDIPSIIVSEIPNEERLMERSESEEGVFEPRVPPVGADSESTSDFEQPNHMFQIVLAGNASVGKSSFLFRLCKDKFYSVLNSTLGVESQIKKLNVGDEIITLQLWDTAGQERFRSITKSYFHRADGVILLYDVRCENSFLDVRDWLETIEASSSREIPIILCGNKIDLRPGAEKIGMPVITAEKGRKLALAVGASFIECSAKDGTNVEKACRDLAKKLQLGDIRQPGITLVEETKLKKTGCCRN